jgi:SsrA-binding protein
MPGPIGWKWGCRGIEESGEGGYFAPSAEVVELVDALRSGRSGRKPVRVRVPPSALSLTFFSVLSPFSVLSALTTRPVDPPEVVAYPLLRISRVNRETTPSAERKQSVARNPKATYDYHILETWETGIVLTGTEVKSLRSGKASIKEAYARVKNGEVFLEGMNITPYEQGNRYNHDPVRTRKLLLHRREIQKLIGAVEQRGLTLVPLELYFKNGRVKIALALGKGKKQHDKREAIKRKIQEREVARAVSIRGRR